MASPRPRKRARRRTGGVVYVSQPLPPALPLPSEEAPILHSYVTSYILDFLDGESCVTAAATSKAFRNALIPRQRNVSMAGFSSYKSMKQMNFTGATFFSGRDSSLVTNAVLEDLAHSFRKLTSIDLSGCQNFNLNGVKSLVQGLGPCLKGFTMIPSRLSEKKSDQRVTAAIIKTVASAPSLASLRLILPTKCSGESLLPLNEKPSIRQLGLMFAGSKPISLPRHLPNLERLSLWTDFQSGFQWTTELARVIYPSLKSLVITDCQLVDSPCPVAERLSAEALISIMSKAANIQSLTIRLISPSSKLHLEKTEQMAQLLSFMTNHDIQYTGPSMTDWRYY